MWNPFKRKCKHKNFEAIESFVCCTGMFYHRLVVYRCARCGVHGYTDSYAFMSGAGILDLYRPKHKDYTEHGYRGWMLSESEYIQQVKDIFNKYFQIGADNIIIGMRIELAPLKINDRCR